MKKAPSSPKLTDRPTKAKPGDQPKAKEAGKDSWRETVESIVVAVVLAFLFRAFVGEAFVIPTGSMAPTLQGRHMDVTCKECGCPYRATASVENEPNQGQVVATNCPVCRQTMDLKKKADPNQQSFNGDRILVSKFAYELSEPRRWEVIVFKYPGIASQNYIKRLVGLPNETIRIRHGDVYVCRNGGSGDPSPSFHIARKEPYKLKAMLQMVDDTNYQSPALTRVGWPPRWQDWAAPQSPSWKQRPGGAGFETQPGGQDVAWLRYRHVIPYDTDWWQIDAGGIPDRLRNNEVRGQLILDYYAYNDSEIGSHSAFGPRMSMQNQGSQWVGDLALEADVEVVGNSGQLLLDLVEGGVHYSCRIDVATGDAVLAIDGGRQPFVDDSEKPERKPDSTSPTAKTRVRGPGRYRLRFSNCDDQLLLWVNEHVEEFNGPTTYQPAANVKPKWSASDPGDLEPLGIGAQGLSLNVSRLRVLRDVYYLAVSYDSGWENDYEQLVDRDAVLQIATKPESWSTTPLFDRRREYVEFALGEDQFFPMGDNSPQSKDARIWSRPGRDAPKVPPPPYVRRDLLLGKALFIYWPHGWRGPFPEELQDWIPCPPNFKRMGIIR